MLNNLPVPKVVVVNEVRYFQIGDDLQVVRAFQETAHQMLPSGLAETLDRFTQQARLTDLRQVVRFAGLPVEEILRQEHIYPVAAYLIQAWWYETVQVPMGPKVKKRLQQALDFYQTLIRKARKNPRKFSRAASAKNKNATAPRGSRQHHYNVVDPPPKVSKGMCVAVWTTIKELGASPSIDIIQEVERKFRIGQFRSNAKSIRGSVLRHLRKMVKDGQLYIMGSTKPLPEAPAKIRPVKPTRRTP